ncbi:coiled-coil domain-containing protein 55-domain containing protein [Thamnocephalis sphaerospora]|uniref:Coiled-coil domain-containing protein 55-domain containing protein n=1 Tax=Thamnocephalis sphaerospora TaxID=78915 RepID=A0A4P9XKR3_9FUNG|nr:coiled-coil domain-containing protein 55-domain containing protein [Thamnocephalis sphaerospora]|eukprot:RKP06031.1 coiled-coil domain-containing protein 55-domain containing protein [Thamnocephalis sphaerospora]
MSFKCGLNLTAGKKKASTTKGPTGARRNVFGGADDYDDNDDRYYDESGDTGSHRANAPASRGESAERNNANKAAQERVNRELREANAQPAASQGDPDLDPSIYAYDEVYDDMKAADRKRQAEIRGAGKERKPRYITNLMQMAEVRKKDRMRADERKVQREREAEGDAFADKEKFVTGAYKAQQEEMRRYEEELKKREQEEEQGANGSDITGFYRGLLETTSSSRSGALEVSLNASSARDKRSTATAAAESGEQPSSTLEDEVAAAVAAGLQVRLNDDNRVVDKRDLLAAGLNVGRRSGSNAVRQDTVNTRARDDQRKAAEQRREQDAEARARMRKAEERRRNQYEDMVRQRDEARQQEQEQEAAKLAAKLARRTTTDQVSDARARFLARQAEKRRQEAQESAEKD